MKNKQSESELEIAELLNNIKSNDRIGNIDDTENPTAYKERAVSGNIELSTMNNSEKSISSSDSDVLETIEKESANDIDETIDLNNLIIKKDQKIKSLNKTIKKLKKKLDNINAQLKEKNITINTLNIRIKKINKEKNTVNNQLRESQTEIAELKKQLSKKDKEMAELVASKEIELKKIENYYSKQLNDLSVEWALDKRKLQKYEKSNTILTKFINEWDRVSKRFSK